MSNFRCPSICEDATNNIVNIIKSVIILIVKILYLKKIVKLNMISNKVIVHNLIKFNSRLNHVEPFINFLKNVINLMKISGEISEADCSTLCLADDTATWVCGRIKECNFVSFSLESPMYNRLSAQVLKKFGFEESLEQTLLGKDWDQLVYMNFMLKQVAIKFIIIRNCNFQHPCPPLSYTINVYDSHVKTFDCEHRKFININADNYYHRTLVIQQDLLEEFYDESIVTLLCIHR
ncbi:late expression factor 12 [Adoxophyes honmai nucleopolyhedrovirus]|uniref:Late expression factor 12 n=1 Tax=Adoxophyes honmai nucleopolyhedrovirus TaxID=224399 RepID=Q80LP5_NPVAH|nr:late expression factor 12 [Adoxophyes honmai nucleopolyhedrovirus]BAC67302.1 late expression factor 12 [Adoxophyes honmai nucleopolyhedrovirus]